MSYSICRIAKVKAGGVTGIQIHDRREKGVSHTNEDIDWSKTNENVDLLEQQERFRTVVNNRIGELNLDRALRKDATVMCQCLVTSDSTFFDKMSRDEQLEYFKKSYEFIENRYGKENMVSATVHFDEKTPHMHVNFVPVTQDGRLSAKDLFGPKDLRKLQDDYNRHCRENGYDLERGKLDSDRKHLSVEEYKVETKYAELKEKKTELERLETVDKTVSLKAEKGKLMYDTKEVEAIKDQNRALKLENRNQRDEIQVLNNKVERLENRLVKTEKELEGTKPHLERLKDLESENKELQAYVQKRPDLQEKMKSFENQKNNAYAYGKAMVVQKDKYMTANTERRKSIEESHTLEKDIKKCDSYVSDLRHRQGQINASVGRLNALQGQLEQTTGLFKGKERKALQEQIEREKGSLQSQTEKLKLEYSVEPSAIDQKIQHIENLKGDLSRKKIGQIEYTNQQEVVMVKAVKDYKYYNAMSETQEPGFREISTRCDAGVELPDYNAKAQFITKKEDKAEILERMEQQHPNNAIKCRELFDQQAQQEQAKAVQRAIEKTLSKGGMER